MSQRKQPLYKVPTDFFALYFAITVYIFKCGESTLFALQLHIF